MFTIARIRIGSIPPEIEVEGLDAATLPDTNVSIRIVQTTRTLNLNWLGKSLELFLMITKEYQPDVI